MRPLEEARHAWQLWNLLTDVTDRLWEVYQDDFLDFCAEDPAEDDRDELDHDTLF